MATFPDGRDAPHLFGLGIVEQLADEITWPLRQGRGAALEQTSASNQSVEKSMQAKGINYGSMVAHADGSLDTSGLQGIDADLRVKPFFAQGKTASMLNFNTAALDFSTTRQKIRLSDLRYAMNLKTMTETV